MARVYKEEHDADWNDGYYTHPDPTTIYHVVGDTRNDYDESPYGRLDIAHRPNNFIPSFHHPSMGTASPLEKATGLSKQFLEHKLDTPSISKDAFFHIDSLQHASNEYSKVENEINEYNDIRSDIQKTEPKLHREVTDHLRTNKRLAGINLAKEISYGRKNFPEIHSPSTLFDSKPGSSEITFADFDKSLRHMMPIVAAHASMKHGELTASDDLSAYSSRLSKKAQEKGLPIKAHPDNPSFKETNPMMLSTKTVSLSEAISLRNNARLGYDTVEVDEDEITGAKQHLRKMLRPGEKPKKISHQFEQLKLPGID